ncbi:MAG TPA: M1 family metallopeptidase [Bryobacteraceae bacterium]|nr:M1 family metallopeptidase [Bryobacteraceae bacterium]
MGLRTAVLWLAALAALNASTTPSFRLGDESRPKRYDVSLTLTPGRDTFDGVIDIDLKIQKPTNAIWLNATEITVHKAELRVGGQTLAASAQPAGDSFEGLTFPREIEPGDARLHIEYSGKVSSHSSAGVFQLKEADRWYLYTQFEPTDARRAFPCFDEPNYKVPWQVTLNVPKDQRAFANTPQVSETPADGGRKIVKFAESRPLPAYLVAFAAGPFEVVDAGTVGTKRTPVRVITPHGKASEAEYAVKAIPQLLGLLEQYFGMPYPYEKLDSIVMPISNFAMENVGLITYGESLLLANPKEDTVPRQREMAIVAAHEMAHQWFGDLVTTAWWDDTWLNEGFASWMETKITAEWKPEWHIDVDEVNDRLEAQNLDTLVSARKVRQPILSDSDIANSFDNITYKKGEAILRMFEGWIGKETFRRGVQAYLKQHADGNATTVDFLRAISSAAGKNIAPAFDTFLDQPGVPLVSMTPSCRQNTVQIHLEQKRYLPEGSPGEAQERAHPSRWQIPVCVRYGTGDKSQTECWLLDSASKDVQLSKAAACPAWTSANANAVGYYYSNGAIDDAAPHLSTAELVGGLGDVYAGVHGGYVAPRMALSLAGRLANDPRREVVESDVSIAHMTEATFMPASTRPQAANYLDELFGARARQLGWHTSSRDNDDTRLLRESLVRLATLSGDDKKLDADAQSMARRWLSDRASVEPGMVGLVLQVAAAHGDRELFDQFHTALANTHDRLQRRALFVALGSFRDPEIAKSAMALLLTKEFDAREAFGALLFGPMRHPETRDLPFEFVKQNLDKLLASLPREVGEDFAAGLPRVGDAFCDEAHRSDLQNFFQNRVQDYVGGPRTLSQTLENIDVCIAQRKRIAPQIEQYLEAQ